MHKLKVAIQALKAHLNLDRRGKELLEPVISQANDLRKKVSALEAELVEAADKLETMRTELQSIRAEKTNWQEAINQAESRISAAEARVGLMAGRLHGEITQRVHDIDDSAAPISLNKTAALVDVLLDRFPQAPVGNKRLGVSIAILEEIIPDLSSKSLENLGLFVACSSLMDTPVKILSEQCPFVHRAAEARALSPGTRPNRAVVRYMQWLIPQLKEVAQDSISGLLDRFLGRFADNFSTAVPQPAIRDGVRHFYTAYLGDMGIADMVCTVLAESSEQAAHLAREKLIEIASGDLASGIAIVDDSIEIMLFEAPSAIRNLLDEHQWPEKLPPYLGVINMVLLINLREVTAKRFRTQVTAHTRDIRCSDAEDDSGEIVEII